ncbi:hypothetical protein PIB30_070972 [Stylosanthes scabra]|uniref:Uncharacterized protein n=1 Tax=Stylosanthes scabra TaxID=79078 RepID=A0ABU6XLU9_9FABA|nr:hypothetical protein [Stylosanthes scabra]
MKKNPRVYLSLSKRNLVCHRVTLVAQRTTFVGTLLHSAAASSSFSFSSRSPFSLPSSLHRILIAPPPLLPLQRPTLARPRQSKTPICALASCATPIYLNSTRATPYSSSSHDPDRHRRFFVRPCPRDLGRHRCFVRPCAISSPSSYSSSCVPVRW